MATWTEELAAALPGRVLFDDGALGAAAGDLSPVRQMRELRGERLPRPAAVVRPQATADVQAAVRFAGRYGVPLLVRGGGSGVVGALEARGGEIVLDLSTLDAIGPIDEESGLVTAGAGCLLGRLEESLAARRLTVGHYPQSIAEASLGGLVATRSSGQYSARYGHIEDMIAELEVVTGDGEAVRLGRRPRRSLGPELWPLFVGSEGTLGVITSVTLVAWPLPEAEVLRSYAFPDFERGLQAMRGLTRAGVPLGVARLYDRDDALHAFPDLLPQGGVPAVLLLSTLGPPEVAMGGAAAADRVAVERSGAPLGDEIAQRWLANRNDVSEWSRYLAAGVLVDTLEVAALWRDLATVYAAGVAALRAEGTAVAFAHAAHPEASGACLYFTAGAVPQPGETAEELQRRLWRSFLAAASGAGASVGHHHGVGRLRKEWTWRERGAELPYLGRVRDALDPSGLLDPGVLWPAR